MRDLGQDHRGGRRQLLSPSASPRARLARLWSRLRTLPGGTWLFSRLLARTVPYTGSIRPHVRVLEPGHAVVTMTDRRAVRNHLNSIHAIALTNLGEVTSGLALLMALPPGIRSIVTRLETTYLKKARGTLMAECRCTVPSHIGETTELTVVAEVSDPSAEVVSRTSVVWRLSPPG